ncbi:MAG: glutamate--tRNA ligase [Bifidobacteriaceae bacterium]|jgi:glutamyl-tRNA synthetase|nr:glutamate--tRNA ligase [Bifidobacteriaceae bacterium]
MKHEYDLPKGISDKTVRVRFCPSPTGTPHVGLIRTALFNWVFAKSVDAKFVFRIEDTDQERDSEESYNQLLDAMNWLGITWDEGVEIGGEYGPYRQSERKAIYADTAKRLLDAGFAYESYSTPEEIQARNVAAGRPVNLGYDGYDRNLTPEQVQKFKDEGRKPSIRIKMPDDDITFTDLVRGEITFPKGTVPDYVIVRANGDALYTLTNPVDDAMMRINTVLRGEDLLSSTPRQIVLYDALYELGIAKYTPRFGHLPYVMGEGNKKLSKRDPRSNLFRYRDEGYIKEGLLNYLALLGWSISPDEDIFSVDDMIKAFDISKVNPNAARFDEKKCLAINATHIRLLDLDDFTRRIVPVLHTHGLVRDANLDALTTREQYVIKNTAPLIQTRIRTLSEAAPMLTFFFTADSDLVIDDDARRDLPDNYLEIAQVSIELLESISEKDFDNHEIIKELLETKLIQEMQLKPRKAFGTLRTAISGRRVSPPLFESMSILGKKSTVNRIGRLE